MTRLQATAAAGFVAVTVAYAALSGTWVSTQPGWYASLPQPSWQPPPWIFGVMWPLNFLAVESLRELHSCFGDDFKVECPTGSGNRMNLFEVAREISGRLAGTFLRDENGHRPVYGGTAKFQDDPHWRDLVLFYEYFHGDTGAGIGASHQTGWTGVVASLIDEWRD